MHVHSQILYGQLKEKNYTDHFNNLGGREGGKKCLKRVKQICFYMHFQGLFKNIDFRSVALVTKKLLAILNLFHIPDVFFRPEPYPII